MVSLFDISTQKPFWGHLSTGVPTLDLMLRLQSDALLDLQSVPANSAFSAVQCSLVASHLLLSPELKVVVLETLNAFPWLILEQHPSFDAAWVDQGRLVSYHVPTFAQLYAFFAFMPLQEVDPGSVLVAVTNFHETIEFYRLQISATHEELLLKHQIDKNRCFLEHMPKAMEEGLDAIALPQVPVIARENPYTKAQNHLNGLILMMSDFAFKFSAVVLLAGHLEPKFLPTWRKDAASNPSSDTSPQSSQIPISQGPTSQNTSFHSKDSSRLVLQPVTLGPSSSEKPNLAESKITARWVFYNDWFDKSPYFARQHKQLGDLHRFFVSVVKVSYLNGVNNINDPVYFHHSKHPMFFDQEDMDSSWLIDLLGPEKEEDALALLIQNSITSTQLPARESEAVCDPEQISDSGAECPRRKIRKLSIPSSPTNFGAVFGDERLDLLMSGGPPEHPEESSEETASEAEDTGGELDESESEDESGYDSDCGHEGEYERPSTGSGDDGVEGFEKNKLACESEDKIRQKTGSTELRTGINDRTSNAIPELVIMDENEHLFIDGSDVELTGTLLEDLENSDAEWLVRHS